MLVIGVFNVGDLVGKSMCYWSRLVILKRRWIFLANTARIAFVPLVVLLKHVDNAVLMLLCDFVMAVTSGYACTVCMISGASDLQPLDQEVGALPAHVAVPCPAAVPFADACSLLLVTRDTAAAQVATNLLVWFLIFGLAAGSFLSFLWLIPGFLSW